MPTSRTESSRSSSSTSSRRTSRANSEAREEILNLLKEDHKRAKKAFRDFEKMDHQDEEACQELVTRTVAELEIHAEIEEDLFYPAVRNALSDDALINEAEVEHMTFKTLIAQLKEMDPSDEKYTATFTVLGEYVKHHVKEEESEMFQGLSRARLDWTGLLEEANQLRQDLMAKRGLIQPSQEQGDSVDAQDPAEAQSGKRQH